MKQFNDITIIGIDQGYGNMKTANTIFPTAITAYDTAPMFKGDVLEYGGKFYRVGEGHKGFVADKSTDGDFYLLTLAAIAKELEQYRLFTASLCLSVGLPLSWVGSQRESFRQYLMQNETIRFRFASWAARCIRRAMRPLFSSWQTSRESICWLTSATAQ